MLVSLLQLFAGIGFICLLVSWWTGRDEVAMIVGIAGAFAWGLVTYGAFNAEVISNGTPVTREYPAVALFALALGVVTFLPALVEPFELIGAARDADDPMERI